MRSQPEFILFFPSLRCCKPQAYRWDLQGPINAGWRREKEFREGSPLESKFLFMSASVFSSIADEFAFQGGSYVERERPWRWMMRLSLMKAISFHMGSVWDDPISDIHPSPHRKPIITPVRNILAVVVEEMLTAYIFLTDIMMVPVGRCRSCGTEVTIKIDSKKSPFIL